MISLRRLSFPFLLLVGLVAGCAAPVHVEYNSASYSQWHNFAWQAPEQEPVKNPILNSGILTTRMEKAVTEALAGAGYTKVAKPAEADFLVTYHTATQLRNEPQPSISFAYGTFGPGFNTLFLSQPGPQQIKEGSLIIDVIDAKTGKLVWRGWITTGLAQGNYSQRAVDRAVQRIFSKFPPPANGS
ncbi:MAG TPA: DUF4136 domain-containing protein [Gammaproteobacteria bacterium]|nr:DUF4136 domain-containing protein [Gammaproteobacteria bacterium]